MSFDLESNEQQLRADLAGAMRTMHALRLNVGSAGNASARLGDGMLITPSAVHPSQLDAQQVVFVPRQGPGQNQRPGTMKPSSEWPLHRAVLNQRNDINAVVHCHSRFATTLACAHRPLPAVHYLVGLCGAAEVPLAPYARFGSDELAQATAEALRHANACLLANHGMVTCGTTVTAALSLAEELEELAAVYWHTLAIDGDRVIDSHEMKAVMDALDDYR